MSPPPEGVDEKIASFKNDLNQKPPALRAWLTFIIADEAMMVPKRDTVLGTEAEMIKVGQAVPAEDLLEFLKTNRRSGQLDSTNSSYHCVGKRFILRHAKSFF